MKYMMGVAAYLLMGWFVGAMFSVHVAVSMAASNPDTMWFWGWLIFWPLFLAVKFFMVFVVVVIIGGICALAYEGLKEKFGW